MLSDDFNDQLQLLSHIQLNTAEKELLFMLMQKQFSVCLCFTIIINKMQNQSLRFVSVNLHSSAFTHDYLYVTLFRAVNLTNVTILLTENDDEKTENIVYSEILLNY